MPGEFFYYYYYFGSDDQPGVGAGGGMGVFRNWMVCAVGPPWGRHEFLKHHSVPFGFPMRWHRNAPFVRASYIRFVFVVFVYEYIYIYIFTGMKENERERERKREREYSTCVLAARGPRGDCWRIEIYFSMTWSPCFSYAYPYTICAISVIK